MQTCHEEIEDEEELRATSAEYVGHDRQRRRSPPSLGRFFLRLRSERARCFLPQGLQVKFRHGESRAGNQLVAVLLVIFVSFYHQKEGAQHHGQEEVTYLPLAIT